MSSPFVIVIPIDFTPAAFRAVEYAQGLSKKVDTTLILLHIIAKREEEIEAEQRFKEFVRKGNLDSSTVQTKVIVGNYLTDIGTIAESLSANLIVMGTHGERGMQKVFGSYALRVVENSKVALLIVQEESQFRPIKKIVMTIDLERESIQIVKIASTIAHYFDAEIILVGGQHEDPILKKKVSMNMLLCKEYLQKENVNYHIELLERKQFDEHLINYCAEHQVDMLAATFYQNTFYAFSDKFVQHLMMNKLHIPLMTIDSTSTGQSSQLSFMM